MIDDESLFTDVMTLRLAEVPGIEMIGRCATSSRTLVPEVAEHCPDVVTLELQTLVGVAHDLIEAISTAWPPTHIVMLTGSDDASLAVLAARSGVQAWVPKTSSVEHLIQVLLEVKRGWAFFPPRHLGTILEDLRSEASPWDHLR